jgi:hypothetical protein
VDFGLASLAQDAEVEIGVAVEGIFVIELQGTLQAYPFTCRCKERDVAKKTVMPAWLGTAEGSAACLGYTSR